MNHIRTQCRDPSWPRGELNLPRGLVTEKAYPEDEWVVETGAGLEGDGSVGSAFVYERRFGAGSQIEVKIPFGWRSVPDAGSGTVSNDWVSGLGDVVLGLKHALHHSAESGTIFSLGGEVILPTGAEAKGLGGDGVALEAFASFGRILPADVFVQAQVGVEAPLYDGSENEAFVRMAIGRTADPGSVGSELDADDRGTGQEGSEARGAGPTRPDPPDTGIAQHAPARARQHRTARPYHPYGRTLRPPEGLRAARLVRRRLLRGMVKP